MFHYPAGSDRDAEHSLNSKGHHGGYISFVHPNPPVIRSLLQIAEIAS